MTVTADVSWAVTRTLTDALEPHAEFPALVAPLRRLVALGPRLVLGLAASSPRSGVLRVSRAEGVEVEALLSAAYQRHFPSLVSYARRHGAGGFGAEDVVQQAFEKVWQRRLRPAEISNMDAYVQTAVRHETWRELGRTQGERERYGGDPTELDDFPPGSGGLADHVVDRVTLQRFLDRLPNREREAVVLRMVWDLTVAEAAETMGVSQGAVKRYCSDGLRRLSDWLRAAP